jgi:glutaredoxin
MWSRYATRDQHPSDRDRSRFGSGSRTPAVTERTITVYSREDCHLCEDALAAIDRAVEEVATTVEVREVDVDTDPELRDAYGERVPYVLVDDRPRYKFRVDEADLRRRLATDEGPDDPNSHDLRS